MPLVSIVMGSDSDLAVMQKAADVLAEFDIQSEMRILSAHRTPKAAGEFAESAERRGVRVLIAGAGRAAHLPGVMAASTILPVIGVPIGGGPLDGLDALYAIVQMPSGIPVGTVGIDGAKNAGLLAVAILAAGDEGLRKKLHEYRAKMADEVLAKDAKLQGR
ncbi:MAG TPA: 5-(carboxyamino)imidazole ribonucleotide mutase [Limnochordia bacterium]|nr:5-(carboxyamino)imidazole ribonucleotide mutase [Limnochordia bacterium]